MAHRHHQNGTPIKINWEGSLFVHHSLGMVNRELLAELIKIPVFDIRHIPYEPDQFTPGESSKYLPLTTISRNAHQNADIHVRHRWPPDFSRPPSGTFVLMQPWEYGSLPSSWCDGIEETVDEVWVYTRFLKTCYERSGIPSKKVKVVPLGIDPMLFNPDAPPDSGIRSAAGNRFCFLYNGGVTPRKGTDILVNAFLTEFGKDEPVCLVIKDSDFYGKGMSAKVKELAGRNDTAPLIYISDPVPHEKLPGLYTACDCYVHPYRAEGYGLPIAEAMACGVPVIVTGGGACLDFVEPDSGYFVKCALEKMKTRQVSDLVTVDYPFWLIPDIGHLQALLRYIFTNQEKARARGKNGGNVIRSVHTWENAAAITEQRILALLKSASPIHKEKASDFERNARIDKAISLLQVGAYREATDEFQKILVRYGENSLAYEGLAIAAFYKKEYTEACNLFAAANRISGNSVGILINWYEAAKMADTVEELITPVSRAMRNHRDNDELRTIAVEIGIL
jgi:glycosyltransferase involved in cell wall biosynthesis